MHGRFRSLWFVQVIVHFGVDMVSIHFIVTVIIQNQGLIGMLIYYVQACDQVDGIPFTILGRLDIRQWFIINETDFYILYSRGRYDIPNAAKRLVF